MNAGKGMKNINEQAFASWVTYLNQLRIDAFLEKLVSQKNNYAKALYELNEAKKLICEEIVIKNRGGEKGIHGFIGERMQVAFKNAEQLINGLEKEYILLDNNGRDDYLRNLKPIQQKCAQSNYGLDAIREHLSRYPDFLDDDGVYQIPKDFYEKLKSLWTLPEKDAVKLPKSDYRIWKNSRSFFNETGMSLDKIEPLEFDYSETQKGTYKQTFKKQEKRIRQIDQENRDKAFLKSKATVKEAGKVMSTGAGIEGAVSLCMSISQKHKEGKKLSEYTGQDWKDVGLDTGKGALKGGIRGGVVYTMSNFTCTPANVASALVTAAFGTMANAMKYTNGEISQEEFIINSEACCLDVGISTVSALLGEIIIPIPVLGAVIGTAVGNFMYGIAQKYGNEKVQKCIDQYHSEIHALNERLEEKYKKFVKQLEHQFKKYMTILDLAFDKDINVAFDNSIILAGMSGVEDNKILKNRADIDNFFLV